MKYRLLALLVVISLVLTGCGIPEEQYAEAVQQRDAALAKVNAMGDDLADANASVTQLQEDKTSLTNEQDTLSSRIGTLEADLETANNRLQQKEAEKITLTTELAKIKKVHPERYFETKEALENWLANYDVPDLKGIYSENHLARALQVQKDAAGDGYLFNIYIDYYPDSEDFWLVMQTTAAGVVYFWYPTTGELVDFNELSGLNNMAQYYDFYN
jgi:hypothetical protein